MDRIAAPPLYDSKSFWLTHVPSSLSSQILISPPSPTPSSVESFKILFPSPLLNWQFASQALLFFLLRKVSTFANRPLCAPVTLDKKRRKHRKHQRQARWTDLRLINGQIVSLDRFSFWLDFLRRPGLWSKLERNPLPRRDEHRQRDVKFISISAEIQSAAWVSINYTEFRRRPRPSHWLRRPFIIFRKACDFQLSGPSHLAFSATSNVSH